MKQFCCFRYGSFAGMVHQVNEATWKALPHDLLGIPILYRWYADGPDFWPKPDAGCTIYEMKAIEVKL